MRQRTDRDGVQYLILADIHANIDALEAVLAAAGKWDAVLVLGDLVGYGAAPNEVVDRVRGLDPMAVIRGNHDKAACGIEDGSNFNQVARAAAAWTLQTLTEDNCAYLRELPAGPEAIDDHAEICHGAPFDEDHYIFDADDALRALASSVRPLCLFAHTHLPVVFRYENEMFDGFVPEPDTDTTIQLEQGIRYLVNAGSVGQPRDGDPRAAFAIYDSTSLSLVLRRVHYPVDAAQRRILSAGLPTSLANRLAVGR
jgi:diadenosine tetraphosphatase ApaH/serine/threonine PP2A family protein phosphatase